ncbi:MAG: DNA repair protein RadC [Alloprevotella sp.]
MTKLGIKEWNPEDRPREKLAALGADALTNAELLAILIGSGSENETSVSLMQRVLHDCDDNLSSLGKLSLHELTAYRGIGPAKAITIMAAMELGRRRAASRPADRPQITSSQSIYDLMAEKLRDLHTEECHVILLNNALRLIGTKCVSRGGLTGTTVDVRLVLREALLARATSMALCHNHPSGTLKPSRADDELTRRVSEAAAQVDLKLIDHLIITDGAYYSYNDEGRL